MKKISKLHLFLVAMFCFTFSTVSFAEEEKPLSFSLGTVRTELEAGAVQYVVKYMEDLNKKDFLKDFERSLFYFTPNIALKTGEKDSFNSLIAKLTGNWLFFDVINVGGIDTPNSKFFHGVPISLGLETNRNFQNVNAIAEIGYIPYFQNVAPKYLNLKKSKIGVFLQGGYKFEVDDTEIGQSQQAEEGGDLDESKESPNDELARIKGSATFNPIEFLSASNQGVGFIGNVDGWYDIINGETYYRIDGIIRFYLNKDKHFDFSYEKGSGAPNFNEGEQYSANLTVSF